VYVCLRIDYFILGSIPDGAAGAGPMVEVISFSGSAVTTRSAVISSPKVVGSNPDYSLVWLECSSRKWSPCRTGARAY